ncbi:MAG: hypothetical protein WBN96_06265 [Gammaproteobacteria bacterium]
MLPCSAAQAGSGAYYGFDLVSHSLDTKVYINQTFTPTPPDPVVLSDTSSKQFTDIGLRLGYKYRRRAGHVFFISPELTLTRFDSSGLNYATTLKFGAQLGQISPYAITTLTHIDKFDKNQFSFGLGAEIDISERICINLAWQRVDTLRENTAASTAFGAQTLTTTSATGREIDIIMLGITFYSHE